MRRALALLLVLSLPGCATLREPVPPGFERVALETQVARDARGQVQGDLDAYSTTEPVFLLPATVLFGLSAGVALGGCAGWRSDEQICYVGLAATGAIAVAALGVYAVTLWTGGLPRDT